MSRIFISYRREDSAGWTGRLADTLQAQFGPESIFIDIAAIEPGADFAQTLRNAVGSCDVLLAVIGPRWSTVSDKSGALRLHDPLDWIRVEISTALTRKIRVVPVLVGGATLPSAELLPDDLNGLAQRQAQEMSDTRWSYDVEQLIKVLAPHIQDRIVHTDSSRRATSSVISRLLTAMMLLFVIGGIAVMGLKSCPTSTLRPENSSDESPSHSSPRQNTQTETHKPNALSESKASKTRRLEAGQEARLKNQSLDHRYQILAAELRPRNNVENVLHLHIRLTNNDAYPTNFWNRTFRLLEDGVPRSPISELSDVVEGQSAKEGLVEFMVPDSVQYVLLQIRLGDDVRELPFALPQ